MPDDKKIIPPTDGFYADDVQAQAMADNNLNPDQLPEEDDDTPVTSGEMEIGDLDKDDEIKDKDPKASYDEEAVPAGDNVSD